MQRKKKASQKVNNRDAKLYIGLMKFVKYSRNEISFEKGDIIMVINDPPNEAFWKGYNAKNKVIGIFPKNFVRKPDKYDKSNLKNEFGIYFNDKETYDEIQSVPFPTKALLNFKANISNEISFKVGDIILVVEILSQGIWRGFCHGKKDKIVGNVKSSMLRVLTKEDREAKYKVCKARVSCERKEILSCKEGEVFLGVTSRSTKVCVFKPLFMKKGYFPSILLDEVSSFDIERTHTLPIPLFFPELFHLSNLYNYDHKELIIDMSYRNLYVNNILEKVIGNNKIFSKAEVFYLKQCSYDVKMTSEAYSTRMTRTLSEAPRLRKVHLVGTNLVEEFLLKIIGRKFNFEELVLILSGTVLTEISQMVLSILQSNLKILTMEIAKVNNQITNTLKGSFYPLLRKAYCRKQEFNHNFELTKYLVFLEKH